MFNSASAMSNADLHQLTRLQIAIYLFPSLFKDDKQGCALTLTLLQLFPCLSSVDEDRDGTGYSTVLEEF